MKWIRTSLVAWILSIVLTKARYRQRYLIKKLPVPLQSLLVFGKQWLGAWVWHPSVCKIRAKSKDLWANVWPKWVIRRCQQSKLTVYKIKFKSELDSITSLTRFSPGNFCLWFNKISKSKSQKKKSRQKKNKSKTSGMTQELSCVSS